MHICNNAAQKKDEEAYASYLHTIETPHVDNSKSLRLTFPSKDDMPFYDCLHKRKVCSAISTLVFTLSKKGMAVKN